MAITSPSQLLKTSLSPRSSQTWTLAYPGLRLSGGYNASYTLYTVTLSPPWQSDIPEIRLTFKTPMPETTSILLPGSSTIIRVSDLEEVQVLTQESVKKDSSRKREFERLDRWFRQVIEEGDELVTVVNEFEGVDGVYCVEARGGVREGDAGEEGFIVVCCYKFLTAETSVRSAVSEGGGGVSGSEEYERILEGL